MNTEDKAAKLLSQILRATYNGSLVWRLTSPPASLTRGTDNFVPIFMEATYKGKDVAIYEERYKHWTDEDEFNWSTNIQFGIYANGSLVTDVISWTLVLGQLFDAAKRSASGVDAIIDDLLD